MAYFTGVPNSISAFAQAIVAAAASVGWTIDRNSGGEYAFHNSDGYYWSIREPGGPLVDNGGNSSPPALNAGQGLYIYTNSGFDNSRAAYNQPPRAATGRVAARAEWFGVAAQAGPYIKYHIFADTHYLHCVLEIRAKVFAHLQFGVLDKRGGNYAGGRYTQKTLCTLQSVDNPATTGSLYNTTTLYVPWNSQMFDASSGAGEPNTSATTGARYACNLVELTDVEKTGRWCFTPAYRLPAMIPSDPEVWGWLGIAGGRDGDHVDSMLLYGSANELTGGTIPIPIRVYLQGAQNRDYFLGSVRDMGMVDMSFLSPGASIFYGSDEWMVFPAWRFNLDDPTMRNSSYNLGYAFKVNR